MEKHLPNFKYVMHWKKYLFFSAGNSASGLAFSSVYVCVRGWSPFLFPKSGEALDGRTGVLHDSLKGWRLSCSATGWGSVGWRSCSCNLLQFPRSQFQCHQSWQPLQRLSKFLYTTPSVFSTQGLVLSSKFRVWFENFWKMHKILWLLRLHWFLVLLYWKNLLSKSWVKVSYLFLNVFENAKGRHWKFQTLSVACKLSRLLFFLEINIGISIRKLSKSTHNIEEDVSCSSQNWTFLNYNFPEKK